MTATDVLCRLLDERGVEYVVDEEYGKKYPPEKRVTWSCDLAGEDMTVTARDYCISIDDDGSADYFLDLDFHEVFTPAQAIAATLGPKVTGNTSDGYHTFNELYHHRAVLFSVIVRDHRELAWKSMRHHDGTMYDGMFIVGIETPEGQATYHYDIDPYWDMFNCKELDQAPEWDGHTPSEAIERIATLGSYNRSSNCTNSERTETCEADETDLIPFVRADSGDFEVDYIHVMECTECGHVYEHINGDYEYCPRCGRKREDVSE